MMKKAICAALLALAFASCSKDKDNANPSNPASSSTETPTQPTVEAVVVKLPIINNYLALHREVPEVIKGKVKTIEEARNGRVTTYYFNEAGLLLKEEENGTSEEHTYNASNQCVESRISNSNGMVTHRSVYIYDNTGNVVNVKAYYRNGSNPTGEVPEVHGSDITLTYDFVNRVVKVKEARLDRISDEQSNYYEATFDAQGNVSEVRRYDAKKVLVSKTAYTPNSRVETSYRGEWLGDKPFEGTVVATENYTYSTTNNNIERITRESRYVDPNDSVISLAQASRTFTYLETDAQGNWTKLSQHIVEGSYIGTTERTRKITYY